MLRIVRKLCIVSSAIMQKSHKRVMVFGVFDLLHPGHVSFLRQAREKGEELIVVVARDSAVKLLKQKKPHFNEKQRAAHVRKEMKAKLVLGDRKLGTYSVIKKYKPDIICVGYDQRALEMDLRKRMHTRLLPKIKLLRLQPHKPKSYHTSLFLRE